MLRDGDGGVFVGLVLWGKGQGGRGPLLSFDILPNIAGASPYLLSLYLEYFVDLMMIARSRDTTDDDPGSKSWPWRGRELLGRGGSEAITEPSIN